MTSSRISEAIRYNRQMAKWLFRALLAAFALAVLSQPSRRQVLSDRLEHVVKPYADAQVFMGSVMVAKKWSGPFQQKLWHGGLGVERSKFSRDSIQHRVDDEAIHRGLDLSP
jgi:hypothetical protein